MEPGPNGQNAFFERKLFHFVSNFSKFHWSSFPIVKLTVSQPVISDWNYGLASGRWQTITWVIVDLVLRRHIGSLGHSDLITAWDKTFHPRLPYYNAISRWESNNTEITFCCQAMLNWNTCTPTTQILINRLYLDRNDIFFIMPLIIDIMIIGVTMMMMRRRRRRTAMMIKIMVLMKTMTTVPVIVTWKWLLLTYDI